MRNDEYLLYHHKYNRDYQLYFLNASVDREDCMLFKLDFRLFLKMFLYTSVVKHQETHLIHVFFRI